MKSASKLLEKLKSTYENDLKSVSDKEAAIKEKIDALTNKALGLKKTYNELNEQRTSIVNKIASLEKQLAGVIQCPKCKHEFTLANDIDVQETRQKLSDERGKEREIEDKITENQNLTMLVFPMGVTLVSKKQKYQRSARRLKVLTIKPNPM